MNQEIQIEHLEVLQLLSVHRVSDVRQVEIHTAEPLVPHPKPFEVGIAIAKFKNYKSPGNGKIPAELIQAGGEKLCSEIHQLINSIWNKEELPDQWKESVIVPIYKKDDETDCDNYHGISLLSTSYIILSNILLSRLIPCVDEIIGIISVSFDIIYELVIRFFCICQILEKKWECSEIVHHLFINFKKACDSLRREMLFSIFIELRVPMILVRLIKMCLNEMYSEVCIG
jgi:hypothetical protein